jgi:hypothetical protein
VTLPKETNVGKISQKKQSLISLIFSQDTIVKQDDDMSNALLIPNSVL